MLTYHTGSIKALHDPVQEASTSGIAGKGPGPDDNGMGVVELFGLVELVEDL